jgi:hypothetical protein
MRHLWVKIESKFLPAANSAKVFQFCTVFKLLCELGKRSQEEKNFL